MPRNAHLVWAVLPILPFALGLVLLEVLYGIGADVAPFTLPEATPGDRSALRFFNAYLLYLTVSFVHVMICAAGLVYLLFKLNALPDLARARALTVVTLLCILLVAVNMAARFPVEPGALTLTYRNICEVVRGAGVFLHLLPETCDASGLSLFALSALLPYLMGLFTALVAAGLVATAVVADPGEGLPRKEMIERVLQLTALVLVTSTVSLMLFYQLPEAVLTKAADIALVHSYGQALTLFWGACFTLTLCFGFGPALLFKDTSGTEPSEQMLTFAGIRQQLSAMLAVLAPLIVGALGPMFEKLLGAV